MITKYVAAALARARYTVTDGASLVAIVAALRGVIAHERDFEARRTRLAGVVGAWIFVVVSRDLDVPRFCGVSIRVTLVR